MAQVSNKHAFKPIVITERYDEAYSELRPYISGWFLGFNTEYKRELIDYKTREIHCCGICGKDEKEHQDIIYPDRI